MARVIFPNGEQSDFIDAVRSKTNLDFEQLAGICGVHVRTFRDWRRDKHRISQAAVETLCGLSGVSWPEHVRIVEEYEHTRRAGQLGAKRYQELYGNPGTPEGRRKGGLNSCQKQQVLSNGDFPSKFVVRKKINIPAESEELAEAIGIILGDGNITPLQVSIAVSALVDTEYSVFIKKLFENLFQIEVATKVRPKNTIYQTMSSKSLVEFLVSKGLVIGDKIRQNIDIPPWIKAERQLMKACIRGLFDTDGSIYYHQHTCKGKEYFNIGSVFTSCCPPLYNSFYQFLISEGYRAKLSRGSRVYLYKQSEVARYLQEVGTHNPKHAQRFDRFLQSRRI